MGMPRRYIRPGTVSSVVWWLSAAVACMGQSPVLVPHEDPLNTPRLSSCTKIPAYLITMILEQLSYLMHIKDGNDRSLIREYVSKTLGLSARHCVKAFLRKRCRRIHEYEEPKPSRLFWILNTTTQSCGHAEIQKHYASQLGK